MTLMTLFVAQLFGFVRQARREEGQALAEYGLILALVAAVGILALTALGLAVSGKLDEVTAAFG